MKEKKKSNNVMRYIVTLLLLGALVRAGGYVFGRFIGDANVREDSASAREEFRKQMVEGCLNNSKQATVTQEQKIAYCGCVASSYLEQYPDNTELAARAQSEDLNSVESAFVSTCLSRHIQS